MKPRRSHSPKARRKAAEGQVQAAAADQSRSHGELLRVQHELRVHQIELEMQNEELRNARAEIEAGLERYTDLYDFAPSGYFNLNEKGIIRLVNLAGAHLAGLPRLELTGRRFGTLLSHSSREAFAHILEKVFASGETQSLESVLLPLDRPPRHVHLAASRSPDARECRLVAIDITERKNTTALLADSQRRLALATESARIGIWEWDVSGDAMICNEQMFRLYGLDRSDPIASQAAWLKVLHPDDRPRIEAEISAALKGATDFQSQYRIILPDGGTRHLKAHGAVQRKDDGTPTHMIGVSWDVTEECRREERIAATLVHEKQLSEEARAGERAKCEFLAVMSHEVRTPVNGILGFAELLANSEGLPPELHSYSRIIAQSSESLLRILDDILNFSRLEAGNVQVETAPFSPRELLDDIRNLFFPQITDKGVDLIVTVAAGVPEFLAGDAGRLRQILLNLVGNAVKFTAQGRITISVGEPSGFPATFDFSVKDTGLGIPAEHIEKIFNAFTQADSSISRRHGGTGLGLTISRRLTEILGGRLTVASQPGEGTEFVASIPFKSASASPAATSAEPAVALDASFADLHPMKILLAEDDPVNLKLISILVRRLGYAPLTAINGKEAVRITRLDHPDCILMDVQMPEMDGIEATRAIRRRKKETPIFVAALTADISPDDRQRCLDAGMDDYLNKPIKIAMLVDLLVRASQKNSDRTTASGRRKRPISSG